MKHKRIVVFVVFIILLIAAACTDKESLETTTQPDQEKNTSNAENDTMELPKEQLQKLDNGDAVQSLQTVLNKLGYEITINGEFDASTVWAITDIQLQHDALLVTGIYTEDTAQTIDTLLHENTETFEPGNGLPAKTETATTNHGTEVIANPYEQLALVNKQHALPEDYIPKDLVIPDVRFPFTEDLPKKQMRKIAASSLEELFVAADEAGLDLFAQSGYRSYERQETIFASNVEADGEEAANKFSARPGESEHQTGLTMDVTSPDIDFQLTTEFANTDEGKWLAQHAVDYGFIIRFPKGKEDITEYQYEPWHIRYVGKKAAKEITEQDVTLEEYLKQEEN
ncbi:D-alanyl-D-alanine carboxypeptidase family protein [Virgibacillus salexigens]|uniref:D-alanyl-D-alanine carboxypeptidase family protein n=1 Tax=Virgibacillus massiliensis TaxID=1462526 RepID=UPI00136C17B5|nr:D-alanyl-D-alanine carboxypeptidase family protein [Virgibacillus massiliensis]MYL43276.1 carboxypeptidase [Virgibacillus massiliensis]